jgi:predicted ester cyclase
MLSNPLDANKTCVRRQFEELWNNGQLDTVNDFFAADFMNFGQQLQDGRTIVKRIVSVWRTAFPDLHFAMDSIVAEGDLVMCEVSLSGNAFGRISTHSAPQGSEFARERQVFQS